MNNVLQLKGRFEEKKRRGAPIARNIPKEGYVCISHIRKLRDDIKAVISFWSKDDLLEKKLLTVYYNRIIAKSNRISGILSSQSKSIVGAKFSENAHKHIITHCVPEEELQTAYNRLDECIKLLSESSMEQITYDDIDNINTGKSSLDFKNITQRLFVSCIVDSFYIEKFGVDTERENYAASCIVTLFDTGSRISELLEKIGISHIFEKPIEENTLLLDANQYEILQRRAPYLIAMSVEDLSKFEPIEDFKTDYISERKIPSPKNEPIIGVIDTRFDESVYFSSWVEYENKLSKDIPEDYRDFHGTYVSSIIVDGPTLNPDLEDGCGRFKVKHFCVATTGVFSSYSILRSIQEIVEANLNIKVWNISLGSKTEVQKNFISPEAYILDKIQNKYDVIFVIAGTNKTSGDSEEKRIGSPADSLNSIVVNSVNNNDRSASYSRCGPVLSFFNKPDISYYGGDDGCLINVYGANGDFKTKGTSFAAPWIARKLAYLIYIVGLNREVAKAMIIDSTIGWKKSTEPFKYVGYGVVPKNIEKIVNSEDDEIKFIIYGISEKYDTYTNNIPVPVWQGVHPFIAKATLCYFPGCSRNQGVDYTNTELDIHFGRITNKGLSTINGNMQNDEIPNYFLSEEEARKYYRKWDNVKSICEEFKKNVRTRKKYETGLWGLSIKSTSRSNKQDREKIRFGLVVTLKEIYGQNRIDDFIYACTSRGWLVNRIDVQNSISIYNQADVEVEFE